MTERWLVVGLGNPGPRYAGNRHNAGFMVLDELARRSGERWRTHKAHAHVAETRLAGVAVVLGKPRSYMNLSGGPVAGLCGFYKIPSARTVVVHDELDLAFGTVRLKRGGSSGGHNGLRSINRSLAEADYVRVRFGVGRPAGRTDPAAYLLSDFATAERADLALTVDRAADAVATVLADGLEKAQNTFHSVG